MMYICSIDKYKGETMCVEITNGTKNAKLFLHRSVVYSHHLEKDMIVTPDDIRTIRHENEVRRARERALYLIGEHDYSRKGLYDKLISNYDEQTAEQVCNELEEHGLIDDRKYGERLCEMLSSRYGTYRVKNELIRKGIDRELAEEICVTDDERQLENAVSFVMKKYGTDIADYSVRQKINGALIRRGYSYSVAKEAVDRIISNKSEEDEDEE